MYISGHTVHFRWRKEASTSSLYLLIFISPLRRQHRGGVVFGGRKIKTADVECYQGWPLLYILTHTHTHESCSTLQIYYRNLLSSSVLLDENKRNEENEKEVLYILHAEEKKALKFTRCDVWWKINEKYPLSVLVRFFSFFFTASFFSCAE